MFAKTFCNSGAFIEVAPIGIRITLRYNARGVIEKIEEVNVLGNKEVPAKVKNAIQKLIPETVPILNGTTWIDGILYTKKHYYAEGALPECVCPEMLQDLVECPEQFTFYAANVRSLAARFTGALNIRRWLSMYKFNILPGFVVPATLTEEYFIHMMKQNRSEFDHPLYSGFYVFEQDDVSYVHNNLMQYTCKKVNKLLNEDGYLLGQLVGSDIMPEKSVPYSVVVKYNIQPNSNVVLDEGAVVYCEPTDSKIREKRSSKVVCSVCGKEYTVDLDSTIVSCDNPYCMSTKYPDVVHMLTVLGQPIISYESFSKYAKSGEITSVIDVLELTEYKNANISATLATALLAATPAWACNKSLYDSIVSKCNYSISTVFYYLENLNRFPELGIPTIPLVQKFLSWAVDDRNIKILRDMTELIDIIEPLAKFEGAPIFRGKHIAITGKFRHGDLEDVVKILKSYSAEVTGQLDENTDCMIIGSMQENIDGRMVAECRNRDIPIYDEESFFNAYDIDSDIEQNLL